MQNKFIFKMRPALICTIAFLFALKLYAADKTDTLKVNWDSQVSISKTTPTLQTVNTQ